MWSLIDYNKKKCYYIGIRIAGFSAQFTSRLLGNQSSDFTQTRHDQTPTRRERNVSKYTGSSSHWAIVTKLSFVIDENRIERTNLSLFVQRCRSTRCSSGRCWFDRWICMRIFHAARACQSRVALSVVIVTRRRHYRSVRYASSRLLNQLPDACIQPRPVQFFT